MGVRVQGGGGGGGGRGYLPCFIHESYFKNFGKFFRHYKVPGEKVQLIKLLTYHLYFLLHDIRVCT